MQANDNILYIIRSEAIVHNTIRGDGYSGDGGHLFT